MLIALINMNMNIDSELISFTHGRFQDFGLGGGHVLTSGRSVVDKWPKSLYNVGGLGGAMALWPPPLEPPMNDRRDSKI